VLWIGRGRGRLGGVGGGWGAKERVKREKRGRVQEERAERSVEERGGEREGVE